MKIREQSEYKKERNREFWVKLSLIMKFKIHIKRFSGTDGISRKIKGHIRYAFIFSTSVYRVRMENITDRAKIEARSISYLFAKNAGKNNLIDAL